MGIIVLLGYVEVAAASQGSTSNANMSQLRILRVLKMLKVMRVVRLMRAFREVRLLLDSLLGSLRPLMWTILLMSAFLFMFAICFVQNVAAHLNDLHKQGEQVDDHELLALY